MKKKCFTQKLINIVHNKQEYSTDTWYHSCVSGFHHSTLCSISSSYSFHSVVVVVVIVVVVGVVFVVGLASNMISEMSNHSW